MQQRLKSGVPGLDEILGGGLPLDAINLLVGLPGTGKTLLAHRYAFENATVAHPAIYLSTVAEPFEKIVRYGQTLSFFDADAVGRRVVFEDLGAELLDDGARGVLDRITALVTEREPVLLVIDSFRPFSVLIEPSSAYRRFLYELAAQLSIHPITSLWLGEYTIDDMATAPEFAIADAVLWLTSSRYEQREIRSLQVLKLRGSVYRSGGHAYRLSADGMRVFPRLADPGHQSPYRLNEDRISTGASTVDAWLGHGLRVGSSTLIAGPSGVGKTVLGLQFVFEGGTRERPSLFATLDENPSQIAAAADRFGWSFEDRYVGLMYRSAVDLHLDEWVYELLEAVESARCERVFVDGVATLRAAAYDPLRFHEYLYSLVQRFSRQRVTLMMAFETAELFGSTDLPNLALSQLTDNVLLLQFLRDGGAYRRALTVLKSRATHTEPALNEFAISASGIEAVPSGAGADLPG